MSWLDTLEQIRNTDWSKASAGERDEKAREVVSVCAYAGSVPAAVPLPIADIALLLPVHSAMVMTVGHIYDRSVGEAEAKRIVLELGAVAGLAFAGHAAIGFLKRFFLPAVGGLLSIPATFALTWGIGRVSMAYFGDPHLSRDDLKKVFSDAMKEGKSAFSMDAFNRFRDQQSDEPAPAEEAAPEPPKEVDPALKPKKRSL